MKKHTIIGMAGHIDHGKTALIKALTGIETDQHKEERERGITIDLGFAYWKQDITIIDVPGHEKFIRNMAAGVSALDLFLLVIAADDGIMPQTIEHLEILKFFGARKGIVALNKIDLVDADWQALVEDEIHAFLNDHAYAQIPIIPVSATTNQGIDKLRQEISSKLNDLEDTYISRPFRLYIDRSFTMKGFGSIVTGTVLSSQVSTGDILTLLPQNKKVKVRGIQIHQSEAQKATTGQRAAINIANIEKAELPRGTALVAEDSLDPCIALIAEVETIINLKYKLKRHSKIRIHVGTDELIGKLYWFDDDMHLQPGKHYHIRIKLEEKGTAAPGDALLIRSFSPVTTLAGGKILFIDPPGIRSVEPAWQEIFKNLSEGNLLTRIKQLFVFQGYKTVTAKLIRKKYFEGNAEILEVLDRLKGQKYITDFEYKNEKHYVSQSMIDKAITIIESEIQRRIDLEPLIRGFNFQQLRNILKTLGFDDLFLERALQKAVNAGKIFEKDSLFTTTEVFEDSRVSQAETKIINQYKQYRFAAPEIKEVSEQLGIELKALKNLLTVLSQKGEIKSIGGKFYLHKEVIEELINFVKNYFKKETTIDVNVMRDFTGCSRKYLIPIFEYLDSCGYTERQNDIRIAGPNLKL